MKNHINNNPAPPASSDEVTKSREQTKKSQEITKITSNHKKSQEITKITSNHKKSHGITKNIEESLISRFPVCHPAPPVPASSDKVTKSRKITKNHKESQKIITNHKELQKGQ